MIKSTNYMFNKDIALEENRICAFIDILGFSSEITSTDVVRREKIITLLKRISEEDTQMGVEEENLGLGVVKYYSAEVTSFSDNIVISIPIDSDNFNLYWDSFLNKIIGVYWDALQLGLLFRGGITIGRLYHKNNVVIGEALVNSANIEKKASFPFIEVDSKSIEFIKSLPIYKNSSDFDRDFLFKNEKYIVNTLGYHLLVWMNYLYYNEIEKISSKEIIKIVESIISVSKLNIEKFKRESNQKVLEKWEWFLSNFLEEYDKGHWLILRQSK